MSFQDQRFQLLNGLAYRVGLTQDVHAVLILLHHFTYARHMPLDVRESFQHIRFAIFLHLTSSFLVIQRSLFRPKRRNRSELLTTVTDESAIAAAAKIGAFSLKKGINGDRMAVGIRITL